jgi:carboxymethylenebutenolidase
MGEMIRLTAADGFTLSAYKATPAGKPKGALVVIQEIFGVNRHMRGVADGYARDGYVAIVPALFDRIRPGIELGYAEADIAEGRQLKAGSPTDLALMDISAARDAVASAGKVGVVGYCWGGFLTYVTATRLTGFSAAVGYYGGGIGGVANEKPHCPTQMHFGDQDHAIPLSEVEQLKAAHPTGVEVHIYHAGHGFNCDERGSFDAASAKQARERAVAFFARHLAAAPARAPVIAGGTASPKAPKASAAVKLRTKKKAKAKPKRRARPAARRAKAKPRRKAAKSLAGRVKRRLSSAAKSLARRARRAVKRKR